MTRKILLSKVLVSCLAVMAFSTIKVAEKRRFRPLPSDEELIAKYRHRYRSFEENDVRAAIRLLYHPDEEVRDEAVTLIHAAFSSDCPSARKAIPRLRELLRKDSRNRIRVGAGEILCCMGDKKALRPLLQIASDSALDDKIRAAALNSLANTRMEIGARGEQLAEIGLSLLYSPYDYIRMQGLHALCLTTDRRKMKVFLQSFVDHVVHPDSSLMAKRSLGTGGGTRYDDFLFTYKMGLLSLAPKAPDILYKLLDHPNETVRYYAAQALARCRNERATGVLIDILRTSEDWKMRVGAISGLSNVGDTSAIPFLKEALKDGYVHEPSSTAGRVCRPVAEAAYDALISTFRVPKEELGEDPTLGHTHVPPICG